MESLRKDLACLGENDGCCTAAAPCGEGDGDCDSDLECRWPLVCGVDNCDPGVRGFSTNDDCCERFRNAGECDGGGIECCTPRWETSWKKLRGCPRSQLFANRPRSRSLN